MQGITINDAAAIPTVASSSAGNSHDLEPSAGVTALGMPIIRRAANPDRDAKALLRFLNPAARFKGFELDRARKAWRLLAMAFGRKPPVASVEDLEIDGPAGPIAIRIFTPLGERGCRPAFLWCHGGGFVTGGLDTSEGICRGIAREAGAVVVAVQYRLAPEHSLYAGCEDFLAALKWVAENGHSIGADGSRLAVGGDSAGGNIAAAVVQRCARGHGPTVRLQVLVYPATNLTHAYPSMMENAKGGFLSAESIEWILLQISEPFDPADPWLSPLRNSDLSGLPSAVVISAGFDPIRDDGLDYAARLRAANVPVELLHYPGQFHGFINFDSVLGSARDGLRRIGRSLARAFRDEHPANCTIEIADPLLKGSAPARHLALDALFTAAFMGRAMRQWTGTLARMTLPNAAVVAEIALRPWWIPAAVLRRSVMARVSPIHASRTYPCD